MLPNFLRPLASLGLTVVLLVLIAAAMVIGTTYESVVGTPLAQADVYHSIWFDVLLGLMAINLTACTLNRYPYRPHQAGWIMTHIGILVILAGAVISRNWGIDGQLMLAEGQNLSVIDQSTHQLEVIFPDGVRGSLPMRLETLPRREGMSPKIIDLPQGRGKITLIRFLPSAAEHTSFDDNPNGVPAVHVQFDAPMASIDQWLWSGDAEDAKWQLPMAGTIKFIVAQSDPVNAEQYAADASEYLIIASPSSFVLRRKVDNEYKIEPIEVGKKIAIGGSAITVTERKNNVVLRETYEPVRGTSGQPALQFTVTDAKGQTSPELWLGYGAQIVPGVADAMFRLTAAQHDLGFSVQLVKFKRSFYPGTNQPASFASDVIVSDPKSGTFPVNISMNYPLYYRGWKFFQSSFIEGTPTYSIFSVAYDPGTKTVYAGCVILILGLIGIFFVKPYLKKKFPPLPKFAGSGETGNGKKK